MSSNRKEDFVYCVREFLNIDPTYPGLVMANVESFERTNNEDETNFGFDAQFTITDCGSKATLHFDVYKYNRNEESLKSLLLDIENNEHKINTLFKVVSEFRNHVLIHSQKARERVIELQSELKEKEKLEG